MGYTIEEQVFEELRQHYFDQRQLYVKNITQRNPPVPILSTLHEEEEAFLIRLPRATAIICQAPNKKRLLRIARASKCDYVVRVIEEYCSSHVSC